MSFKALHSLSLTEQFVKEIEKMIFSGQLKPGEKLPTVRELAEAMEVSPTVVNTGCAILSGKGLIRITPRKGMSVIDFRSEGGLDALNSMVDYSTDILPKSYLESMYQFRYSNERTFFFMAVQKASEEELEHLMEMYQTFYKSRDKKKKAQYLFQLVREVSIASHNNVFPMITNGFESLYLRVFEATLNSEYKAEYISIIKEIFEDIRDRKVASLEDKILKVQEIEYRVLYPEHGQFWDL